MSGLTRRKLFGAAAIIPAAALPTRASAQSGIFPQWLTDIFTTYGSIKDKDLVAATKGFEAYISLEGKGAIEEHEKLIEKHGSHRDSGVAEMGKGSFRSDLTGNISKFNYLAPSAVVSSVTSGVKSLADVTSVHKDYATRIADTILQQNLQVQAKSPDGLYIKLTDDHFNYQYNGGKGKTFENVSSIDISDLASQLTAKDRDAIIPEIAKRLESAAKPLLHQSALRQAVTDLHRSNDAKGWGVPKKPVSSLSDAQQSASVRSHIIRGGGQPTIIAP